MKLVIIDYGLCNLRSVYNALKFLGVEAKVTSDAGQLDGAERAILPGVGAFADGMKGLQERRLAGPIRDFAASGRPLLGICLGMQFLMSKSHEFGEHEGLDLISGEVVNLHTPGGCGGLKVPHIGWNNLQRAQNPWEGTILQQLDEGAPMYFVHSFHAVPKDPHHVLASTEYGPDPFCSVIAKDNIYGCQFHPEKSAEQGLKILHNFIHLKLT